MPKIIIHGVHRSGTSLTASLFERAGCWYAQPDTQMAPQEDNPKGFWESVDVVELNDQILAKINLNWFTLAPSLSDLELDGLADQFGDRINDIAKTFDSHSKWFLKDPRFSITWPLWAPYLDPSHHIVVHRHPLSVAKSLYSRNGIPIQHGLFFWYHQTRMIASALSGQESILHIEFGSQEHLGTKAVELVNNIVCSDGGASEGLLQSDFDSIYESALVHHNVVDESLLEEFPIVASAWKYAQEGNFDELLALPEIPTSALTWNQLDSRAALGCHIEQHQRDVSQSIDLEAQLRSEIRASLAINQGLDVECARLNVVYEKLNGRLEKLDDQYKTLSQQHQKVCDDFEILKDEAGELNLRLLKIAGELKGYILSKRYFAGAFVGRVLQKLKVTRPKTLDEAFNIAIYGQSSLDIERHVPIRSNRSTLLAAMLRNPFNFVRKLSFKRIGRGVKVLSGRDQSDIEITQSLLQYSHADVLSDHNIDIFDPDNSEHWRNKNLEFEVFDTPKVSIVIPVYNNYMTTLACLHSIKKHTDQLVTSYEVIVADDCSTDETKDIGGVVTGLKIVRGEQNQGFLKNCNTAIPTAKGDFLVLLNNDTNVQENWLSELLLPLETSDTIGITGPTFLYPDGRLQEAGGIVFSDASGWNYGRLDQPSKPEYSFARDVDYISGACLVFRKTLWDQIGGFDEVFAPAYYEDTDFCFETRKLGLTVRFVPTAKVVHFEGVSHGSSESSGIKKYQAINRDKFFDKWKDCLSKDHYPDSTQLFSARIHGRSKKTLLFIDHYVPFHDKDAGSKVAQRYLELLVQEGVHVIFLGDNFYPHQPYTAELQALGVEVLHGEYYKNNWYQWLREYSPQIDTIYLNRPHISSKYIDKIRALEHQPYVAYHGADLHYVRVAREDSLGITPRDGMSSDDWKAIEFDIMRKCDISLWLSQNEVDLIQTEDASLNVKYKPMYWFEESYFDNERAVVNSKQLLFVGGFGHPPNKDGLEWFLKDIYPFILERHPTCKLTVIGSNCPDEIKQLESENLAILGYVSEQELINAYSDARVAIVPLRYGAGVKGKVIESMKYGVPVVTTSIGAEGLPSDPADFLAVADDAEMFIRELNALLELNQLCKAKIDKSDDILKSYFSVEAAKTAVKTLLP
jgi:GT2 family glycosyltransferase